MRYNTPPQASLLSEPLGLYETPSPRGSQRPCIRPGRKKRNVRLLSLCLSSFRPMTWSVNEATRWQLNPTHFPEQRSLWQ